MRRLGHVEEAIIRHLKRTRAGMSAKDIHQRVHTHRSTVQSALRRLIERELVERERGPNPAGGGYPPYFYTLATRKGRPPAEETP